MNKNSKPRNGIFFHSIRSILISMNKDLFLIQYKMDTSQPDFDEIHYLIMALEDRRFMSHRGVDYKSIIREFFKKIRGKKHGGASTIDMQMVRTITNYKEITLKRKTYEIILAFSVNFKYSKKQIINCYLQNAYFGYDLIGLESACHKVYGKKSSDLNLHEKARIAAMLLRPRPKKPSEKWELAVKSRAAYAQSVRMRMENSN